MPIGSAIVGTRTRTPSTATEARTMRVAVRALDTTVNLARGQRPTARRRRTRIALAILKVPWPIGRDGMGGVQRKTGPAVRGWY